MFYPFSSQTSSLSFTLSGIVMVAIQYQPVSTAWLDHNQLPVYFNHQYGPVIKVYQLQPADSFERGIDIKVDGYPGF